MPFFREENNKVIVDPQVKLIREFRALVAYDKDRNKREAVKWFGYIYYMEHYKSPYLKVSKDERHEMVCMDLMIDLPFKVPKVLEEAIVKYRDLRETSAVKTLKSIKEGLVMSDKVIDMINTQIHNSLEIVNNGDVDTEDIPGIITSLTSNVDKLLGLSDKVPKAINTIKTLEEEVKKEQASDTRIRGGGEKGAFED